MEYLTEQHLNNVIESCRQSGVWARLVHVIGSVFIDPEALMYSFITNSSSDNVLLSKKCEEVMVVDEHKDLDSMVSWLLLLAVTCELGSIVFSWVCMSEAFQISTFLLGNYVDWRKIFWVRMSRLTGPGKGHFSEGSRSFGKAMSYSVTVVSLNLQWLHFPVYVI